MRDRTLELLVEKLVDEFGKLRKAQGLSHEKMAFRTGISTSAVSLILSHKRTPTILTCLKMAKALGVRLSDILNRLEK
jgi:transcriptional regulator with XRE-family HTH domain